jgi:peroxiredoxin
MTADVKASVADGERPVIRRLVPDVSRQLASGAAEGRKREVALDLTHWEVNPKLDESRFTFTPPEGAEKADSLMAMFGQNEGEEPSSKLIGQPAPPFELATLAGPKMSLAENRGKNIVVLDFWATWCGPCVKALPIVSDVARTYAGKGVVVYAVNQQEDAPTIRAFLQQQKLELNVALDEQGSVGELYGVTGIPQTVVIGRDGTVADVHVGYNPQMKALLSKKIDELLAAKGPPATQPSRVRSPETRPAAAAAR